MNASRHGTDPGLPRVEKATNLSISFFFSCQLDKTKRLFNTPYLVPRQLNLTKCGITKFRFCLGTVEVGGSRVSTLGSGTPSQTEISNY